MMRANETVCLNICMIIDELIFIKFFLKYIVESFLWQLSCVKLVNRFDFLALKASFNHQYVWQSIAGCSSHRRHSSATQWPWTRRGEDIDKCRLILTWPQAQCWSPPGPAPSRWVCWPHTRPWCPTAGSRPHGGGSQSPSCLDKRRDQFKIWKSQDKCLDILPASSSPPQTSRAMPSLFLRLSLSSFQAQNWELSPSSLSFITTLPSPSRPIHRLFRKLNKSLKISDFNAKITCEF